MAEAVKAKEASKKAKTVRADGENRGPLGAVGAYFKGAWQELRQVRWPNRRNTWSLTLAVLGFTAFFAVLILLVDAGFQYLFREILLK